ncbi:MAG: peptide-methionine (S)-S-oxide reductase MsrA [Chitinophagaceae bacterium]|nr:peptide-methionine (S)-S-oxide reductase MsrA [Chitinophagaceae bacterium]
MNQNNSNDNNAHSAVATFGAGCFWCTEAQFQQLKGVSRVVSGYMGGSTKNPSYKEVCTGSTGHAEVTNVYYDPSVISFDELLAAFFVSHDPTQLNRQGNDIGTQYRSVVFYHDAEQKEKAEGYIKKLNEEKVYPSNIVTEVSAADTFYAAEDYHQNYYNQNGSEPYCHFVIQPKLEKFKKVFKDKLK